MLSRGETTHYILRVALLLQNVFAVHRSAQGAADWWSGPRWSIISVLYPVHPFPLRGTSPQGETRSMERKNRESYISCTIPQFPPLVVNAVSQSPECVSCHMTQKVNPVTLTLCSSPHRAIPHPSARRAVKLKNPPALGPVNPKNLPL